MKVRWMIARLLALFRKQALDRELDDEVSAYLELAERDAIAAGLTPQSARRAARLDFGGIEQMKETHRDERGVPWIENLVRDFRHGLSSLGRNPGFGVIAVGLLALGVGATTAVFTLVDAVLLRPLPFPEPERIVRVWETPPNSLPNVTTSLTFLDWKRQGDLFEALSAVSRSRAAMTIDGDPVRVRGMRVSADYFKVFGVAPEIGRSFAPGEDQPGSPPLVVLSHRFWQTRWGGDPSILERELRLDGKPYKVIGVLPAGPFDRDEAEFWTPLVFAPEQLNRDQHWLRVIGRLRRGVSLAQAQAGMTAVRASLSGVMAVWKKDWGFAVEPFDRRLVDGTFRRSIYLAFGAVLLVLFVACANVANLMLTRGASRRREMALRAALGAGRSRLVGQLLTESLVLCLMGGLVGVPLALGLLRFAAPLLSGSLPFTADLSLDLRVVGFASAAVMASLILAGLFPSLRTSFSRLSTALNQAARGSSSSSAAVRRAIVIGEVAVSVVLICGALLLYQSLLKLKQVDPGVRVDHVMTMSVDLPAAAYPHPEDAAGFYEAVVQRLRAVPGVEEVSIAHALPLERVRWGESIGLSGERALPSGLKPVDPWYFTTLEIPVVSGRGIEQRDRAGALPIVVINEAAARLLSREFGVSNPVGRIVQIPTPGYGLVPETMVDTLIVGVIRNERTSGLQVPERPVAYVPLAQVPQQDIKLLVRTQTEPTAVMSPVREAMRQLDPDLPLGDVRTLEQVKDQSMQWARQPAWALGAFAGLAALLAALGLYGVLAHGVAQQRREIGIRMALGARSADVLSHVLGNGVRMIAVGLVLGLSGALALTRLLESLLFETSALDPLALGIACVLMLVMGMLAAWLPANRAARMNPVQVLHEDG